MILSMTIAMFVVHNVAALVVDDDHHHDHDVVDDDDDDDDDHDNDDVNFDNANKTIFVVQTNAADNDVSVDVPCSR